MSFKGGGAPRNPELTLLWQRDPSQAAQQVLRALRMSPSLFEAAELLGVGHRTLCRWIAKKPQLIGARASGDRLERA